MKLFNYISSILVVLFSNCSSPYLPFKTSGPIYNCENTFCFNTPYKINMSLNDMSQKLTSLHFTVSCDTFYTGKKWFGPSLHISNYTIDNKEIERIDFSVFESRKKMYFYGFCLKRPLIGTNKEIMAQSKAIREKIERDIAPLISE
jgi:hypothetical protein